MDDNPGTSWKMGRRTDVDFDTYYGQNIHYMSELVMNLFQHKGWLEVELDKPQLVNRVAVSELNTKESKINAFAIQYEKGGQWITLAQDTRMGEWSKPIDAVRAQKFRLLINDSQGYPGIREFQLFGDDGVGTN